MIRSIPFVAIAMLGVALTGCNHAVDNEQTPAPAAATTNYLAQIEALPQGQREGVFLRAIRDSGQECQGVTASQESKDDDGKPAWTATCSGGAVYVLVLGSNGVMTVVSPRDPQRTG